MPKKSVLKPIKSRKEKLNSNDRDRFENMCLKITGYPKETKDELVCELPEGDLSVKKDLRSATVVTPEEDGYVRGYVEDVKHIAMTMVEGETPLKTIRVKGEDDSLVSISSFVED